MALINNATQTHSSFFSSRTIAFMKKCCDTNTECLIVLGYLSGGVPSLLVMCLVSVVVIYSIRSRFTIFQC